MDVCWLLLQNRRRYRLAFSSSFANEVWRINFGRKDLNILDVANQLNEEVVDGDDVEHDKWIVTAPFRIPPCSNIKWYLPDDEILENWHVRLVQTNNVELYQTRNLDDLSDLQFHCAYLVHVYQPW